jgi:hypothetical protein
MYFKIYRSLLRRKERKEGKERKKKKEEEEGRERTKPVNSRGIQFPKSLIRRWRQRERARVWNVHKR